MPERLRDRLYHLLGSALGAPHNHDRPAMADEHRATMRRALADDALERHLGGHWIVTEGGPAFVIEQRYPLQHRHGRWPLSAALEMPPEVVSRFGRLDPTERADLRRAAFIDIETTGLAGGAGTLPFLIGSGRYEGAAFVVRQFFMPDPVAEAPVLQALAAHMDDAGMLVTFNGRAFDIPILETRFIYHRYQREAVVVASPFARPHIDLLYPARRLWRGWLPSCRLAALEQYVLGFERGDDIPSAEIPGRYFHYLRSGRIDLLQPVFKHNAWDILSMVTLAAEIGRLHSGLPGDTPKDLLVAARLAEREGDLGRAALYYRRALESRDKVPPPLPEAEQAETMVRLAAVYRRLGQWAQAAALWQALIERPGNLAVRPYLDLAKYHERRLRDLTGAIRLIRSALTLVERYHLHIAPEQGQVLRKDLQQRLARLQQKAGVKR